VSRFGLVLQYYTQPVCMSHICEGGRGNSRLKNCATPTTMQTIEVDIAKTSGQPERDGQLVAYAVLAVCQMS